MSLDQKLSTSALIEILLRVPLDVPVPAVSRTFHAIWTSEAFLQARRAFGTELQLLRPRNSKDLLLAMRRVVQRFRCRTCPGSVRVEFRHREKGEKPSMSFDDPYFRFLQLRDGGVQIPAEPMEEDLYLNGLDPVGGGPVRTAWWAVVRSVLDGTAIPSNARILLLGDRRMGGRSAYSLIMALVWTGKDYGIVKCHLDPAYLDCTMEAWGGIQAQPVAAALEKLEKSKGMKSFKDFAGKLEDAINTMTKGATWTDEWSYPTLGDDSDDEPDEFDEEKAEKIFQVFEAPDSLGPWWIDPAAHQD